MKKYLAAILALVMVLCLLAGCGQAKTPAATAAPADPAAPAAPADATTTPTYTIKLGHACSAVHPYNQGAQKFKELVEAATNGDILVELYSDSTLGAERDLIEGLQMGTVEMCIVSTAPLSSYSNAFLAFDLPFLFTSKEQARGVVDSEIGQSMFDDMAETSGITGLCYFENGFRHFTNDDHPIVGPEDLKGMKIRVMENQVMMAFITACGGSPTPMAFNELYTALQQKTIDGEENPIGQIYDKKFYEVQHYVSLTGHWYAPAPLLISTAFLESLPAEYQQIVKDAAMEARLFERGRCDAEEADQLAEIKDVHGCEITTADQIDVAAFQAAGQAVFDEFVGEGKLIDGAVVEAIRNYKP